MPPPYHLEQQTEPAAHYRRTIVWLAYWPKTELQANHNTVSRFIYNGAVHGYGRRTYRCNNLWRRGRSEHTAQTGQGRLLA